MLLSGCRKSHCLVPRFYMGSVHQSIIRRIYIFNIQRGLGCVTILYFILRTYLSSWPGWGCVRRILKEGLQFPQTFCRRRFVWIERLTMQPPALRRLLAGCRRNHSSKRHSYAHPTPLTAYRTRRIWRGAFV